MNRCLRLFAGLALGVGLIVLLLPASGSAQAPAAPVPGPLTQGPPPAPGEREIKLEREHPLEAVGLAKPEVAGFRISGFFLGSANYNNRIQMVPEFAGGSFATSEPGQLNFSFDKFTIGVYRTFAPWLSAGASIAVEQHKIRQPWLRPRLRLPRDRALRRAVRSRRA